MREEQGPSRRDEPIVDDEEKGQDDDEGNKSRTVGEETRKRQGWKAGRLELKMGRNRKVPFHSS